MLDQKHPPISARLHCCDPNLL